MFKNSTIKNVQENGIIEYNINVFIINEFLQNYNENQCKLYLNICNQLCENCNSYSKNANEPDCINCNNNFVNDNNEKCYNENLQIDSFYYNLNENNYVDCDESCKKCNGDSNNECTECFLLDSLQKDGTCINDETLIADYDICDEGKNEDGMIGRMKVCLMKDVRIQVVVVQVLVLLHIVVAVLLLLVQVVLVVVLLVVAVQVVLAHLVQVQ